MHIKFWSRKLKGGGHLYEDENCTKHYVTVMKELNWISKWSCGGLLWANNPVTSYLKPIYVHGYLADRHFHIATFCVIFSSLMFISFGLKDSSTFSVTYLGF
jgi:hypothetical protein